MFDDDFEKEKRKLVFKEVARVIKEHPKNYMEKLAELGFRRVDDEVDEEAVEERTATIRTDNERYLVGYLEGDTGLSDQILNTYLAEKDSDNLNYPLFRGYFKKGNDRLKELLMYGLKRHPTDIGLLSDLAYYHEFRNVLGELIEAYMTACGTEHDLERFSHLVMSFYLVTEPDGFDALHELEQVCSRGSDEWDAIQSVRAILKSNSEPEDIEF